MLSQLDSKFDGSLCLFLDGNVLSNAVVYLAECTADSLIADMNCLCLNLTEIGVMRTHGYATDITCPLINKAQCRHLLMEGLFLDSAPG